MNTQNLFQLANAAKNCGDYDLANQIFAVLAHAVISGSNEILIGYEQDQSRDDIVENLSDPDGAGYYDLPFLFDGNDNYLCIPLPLVSRHFCNHIVWRCRRWKDREQGSHNRSHWRLQHSEDRRAAASRDLWRRFYLEVDKDDADRAAAIILAPPEIEEAAPIAMDEPAQWFGPATLAKLRIHSFDDYEETFEGIDAVTLK